MYASDKLRFGTLFLISASLDKFSDGAQSGLLESYRHAGLPENIKHNKYEI